MFYKYRNCKIDYDEMCWQTLTLHISEQRKVQLEPCQTDCDILKFALCKPTFSLREFIYFDDMVGLKHY